MKWLYPLIPLAALLMHSFVMAGDNPSVVYEGKLDDGRTTYTVESCPPGASSSIYSSAPPTQPLQSDTASFPAPAKTTDSARVRRPSCEKGHWVESVEDDGKIVVLEDGSQWEIDDVDTVDTDLWLPTTDITVCDGKLINTEDHETAGAVKVR